MKKGEKIFLMVALVILLLVPLISAGFFDWVKKSITGYAGTQATNVSVSISGANQAIVERITIVGGPDITPTENGLTNVVLQVIVADADGVNDINDSATTANITTTVISAANTDQLRGNSSCVTIGDLPPNRTNFTCTIGMWFYDGNATYNISASANDRGNLVEAYNISEINLSFGLLKAFVVNTRLITFTSVSAGGSNAKASNETIINNTGNYNSTIQVTAIELRGETISSEVINATNFTVGTTNDCDTANTTCTYMVNATAVTVTSSIANRGNYTKNDGAGQESLFYCLPGVPQLSTQTYSSNTTDDWIITFP